MPYSRKFETVNLFHNVIVYYNFKTILKHIGFIFLLLKFTQGDPQLLGGSQLVDLSLIHI